MSILSIEIFKKHNLTIKNYFWRFIQIFIKQGTSFIIFYLSSYFLSPSDFGKYSYLMTIIFLLASFCDFGISVSVNKQVVEIEDGSKEELNNLIFNSLLTVFFFSTVISSVFIFSWKYFFPNFFDYKFLIVSLIYIIPFSSILDGIYRGLKKFKLLSIVVILSSILSLLFLYPLIKYFDITGSILSQVILYLLISILLFVFVGRLNYKFNFFYIKKILNYAIIVGIGSVAYFFYSRIDVFFLGKFNYFDQISYFEIINKINSIILLPIYIFAQVISPYITKHSYNKNYDLLIKKFKNFLLYSIILAFLLTLFMALIINPVVSMFFAKYYSEEFFSIFYILIFVLFISILNGIFPQGFMASTGDYDLVSKLLFIFGIINVLLDYIFIKQFGAIGIAYSSIIVVSLSNLLMIFMYYFRLVKKYEKEKLQKNNINS